MQQFPDWLRRRAASNPDRIAVICGESRLTFREFDARVDDVAYHLLEAGAVPGDHIAILLPNSLAFAEVIHAISRIGAISVPINLRLTPNEIAWQLADVDARLIITTQVTSELLDELSEQCPGILLLDWDDQQITPDVSIFSETFREYHDTDAVHSIVYTSGTTGRPKGAMLTYGNHWWSAVGSAMNLGAHTDDRWLAVLPLFHVGGLSILLRGVIFGITVVIHESFDPDQVNQSIKDDRVTIISVVSTMLQRMLDASHDDPYPSWLRCVLLGGGPAPKPLLERCAAINVPVTQTYGLTETASQFVTLSPEDALRRLGAAGKALYPGEIRIADESGALPHGQAGEILVRGPNVTAGYFRRPDATVEAMDGAWFRTGDAGFLDEDGYLHVLDRRDDLIVTGGENVYPAEVEAVLSGYPHVVEAGVVGITDPEWGQVVVAMVSVSDLESTSTAEIQTWCRDQLAGYKIPRKIYCTCDPLPRNAGGKLLRRKIRQVLEQPERSGGIVVIRSYNG